MTDPFISYQWNNEYDSLKIGLNHLYLRSNRKFHQFHFNEIISAELLTKKKLAPLVSGAIVASLAMVNILLEGASLYMVAFLFSGLLVLYFGLTDYWVIKIVHSTDSTMIWINKNKTPRFPEVILSVVHYRIKQGEFPPLYCQVEKNELTNYLEERNEANPAKADIRYTLLPPKPLKNNIILKIDASQLSKPLTFASTPGFLATGKFKINSSALLDMTL